MNSFYLWQMAFGLFMVGGLCVGTLHDEWRAYRRSATWASYGRYLRRFPLAPLWILLSTAGLPTAAAFLAISLYQIFCAALAAAMA